MRCRTNPRACLGPGDLPPYEDEPMVDPPDPGGDALDAALKVLGINGTFDVHLFNRAADIIRSLLND